MAIDDATAGLLAQLGEMGVKPLHEMTPQEARDFSSSLRDPSATGPDVARRWDERVPGADGETFGVRVLVPEGTPTAVIVHYHGGGWVIGGIDESEVLARHLATRTGAAVVLVDYRLAPEHRYPTAADDAWAALRWTAERRAGITGDRDVPLIVLGDSAGGNLAAVVAQRAVAEGGPDVALQVLVYPVTDADLDNASYTDPANQLLLSRDSMVYFWDHYAPDVASRGNPDASPARAADVAGVAPAVVLIAEHDPLRDEGEAYAEQLRAAGVPVEVRLFPGQMHGFFTMVGVLPGSAAGIDFVVEQIGHALERSNA